MDAVFGGYSKVEQGIRPSSLNWYNAVQMQATAKSNPKRENESHIVA